MVLTRIDIMTDIETLGHKSDSTIIQIAAIDFDIETGIYISQFNEIVDITKNKTMSVTGSTIKWWLNTDRELLTKLINEGKYSSEEVLIHFYDWLVSKSLSMQNDDLYLWGNGILFDNKMLQHQMELIGLGYPIFYRNDRDMRTIVDLASKKLDITEKELRDRFIDETLVAHDAFDDVRYQIKIVSECYKLLTNS